MTHGRASRRKLEAAIHTAVQAFAESFAASMSAHANVENDLPLRTGKAEWKRMQNNH
jgi:hypothetical protein